MKAGELAAILLTDPKALVVIPGYEAQLDEAKVVMKTTVSESPSGEYYGCKKPDVERTILLDEQVDND